MAAHYIYKINSMVTAFSVTPTLVDINYVFTPDSSLPQLTVGDLLLIYKSSHINMCLQVNTVDVDSGRVSLLKMFDVANGCPIESMSDTIASRLSSLDDNTFILVEESDYNSIVNYAFDGCRIMDTIQNDSSIYKCVQKIYFGAPGTGKSHTIKNEDLKGVADDCIFRTTFHPDSDYSSFVGCYKPITHNCKILRVDYTIDDLASILKQSYADAPNKVTALHSFVLEYAGYFNGKIATFNKRDLIAKSGLSATYEVEVGKIVNLNQWMVDNGYISTPSTISYEFSPEMFTNAYVEAWNNPTKSIYLIIEEINRGNCAQVFGDIFQLLDRADGVSEYAIKADAALCQYLQRSLSGEGLEGIKDGKLKLPSNLSIIATMNTSDQSLFPMDSAFKRRWDWVYTPINTSEIDDVMINIGDNNYSWSKFISKVNIKIEKAHDSEDKQLGPYFVKATKKVVADKELKYISEDQFVSKVMFYLWYEVFKDEVSNTIFITKEKVEGQDKFQDKRFTFNKLFVINSETKKSEIDREMLEKFLVDSLDMKPEYYPDKKEDTDVVESGGEQSEHIAE